MSATVAIPVRNGGPRFERVLDAVRAQRFDGELEILVCDSGSTDGSLDTARRHGARVIEIEPSQFSHGGTRNLLLREARGLHVALLTQDAEPASTDWLEHLLAAFELADDVGLVYGRYVPRPDAPPIVRHELERWFASLTPGVERLAAGERDLPAVELMGRRGFFSDANAAVSRSAWERVPFREVEYAEDRALAVDMLRAGFAKVYEPAAAVLHSHHYGSRDRFRRAFDESRGMFEVYGWREPLSLRRAVLGVRGELSALRSEGAGFRTLLAASIDQSARLAGAVLGARAERLPAPVRRRMSLESRASATAAGHDVHRR